MQIMRYGNLSHYYYDQIEKIMILVLRKKRLTSEMKETVKLSLITSQKALALFTKKCEQLKSKEYCERGVQDAINQLPIMQK